MKECSVCGARHTSKVCYHELSLSMCVPRSDNPEVNSSYWRVIALKYQAIGIDLVEKLGKRGVKVMKIR